MKVLSDVASGTAHGKIILIGEHAVVYNEPAIAIPFTSANVEITVQSIQGESTIDSIYHKGKVSDAPRKIQNLVETFKAVCNYFERSYNDLHFTVTSNIPAERGMGSSAAVATALVRALFNFYDEKLTDELLQRFVSVSERIAHGNPSGLDAKVVRSDYSVYFIRNQAPELFRLELPAFLVVADTGEHGETGKAVRAVEKLVNNPQTNGRKLIKELGQLTVKARTYIEQKDLKRLGEMLDSAHEKLQQLNVSNERLDTLVKKAKESGALGAKLTGGGRGGCMIAFVDDEKKAMVIAEQLEMAGATKTWIHPLGGNTNDN